METRNLKPAKPDLLVRLEDGTGFFPKEGKSVALTTYIRRRIADGDLIPTTQAKKKGGE